MGLDIYLYRYDDFEKSQELESKYEEHSTKLWEDAGEYKLLTQEQKDEINAKIKEFAHSLGLDEYGEQEEGKTSIEMDYEKNPEHYFKIGYFRSSYNSSGINRILGNFGLPRLEDIFGRTDDDYKFQPNWEESLVRCEKLIEDFKKIGPYRVHHVSQNMFSEPEIHSEKEALDVFLEELNQHNKRKDNGNRYNYSNKHGDFNIDEPVKVLAMIPGDYNMLARSLPCVYIVTESDNDWYVTALEIVKETIKYVLSKEDKEKYYLHWSA